MVERIAWRELGSNAQDGEGKGKMSGQKGKLLKQLQRESYAHKIYPAEHSVHLKYVSPTSTAKCMVKRVKSSL